MSASAEAERPAICLNMIVRNEAHIVNEVIDAVAPYITSWVIVDTGSRDGTQDVIEAHMKRLDIPGELHERPWQNFGVNRSEALALAQGHGDYIWVMDADDTIVGGPDFSALRADVYDMRIRDGLTYWRRQLFRDGMPWHYQGVVHEYADCDVPFVEERLDGDYHIQSRRLGGRNKDAQKYARDRDLLLAEVDRNPDDARSVFYLSESYFNMGDYVNARRWAQRRAEMGGWAEEAYFAMYRIAESMSRVDEPWPDVQHAYLRAWEFRPTRAEPLYAIARRYRTDAHYQLGYLFAERAAGIRMPAEDYLFVAEDVYNWRAIDEQAVCASWIGKHQEAFALCRRMLARPDIPDDDRHRISANRDICVPTMLNMASEYPKALVRSLIAGPPDSEVTVTLLAGPDRATTEQTLDSFLSCCLDVRRVGRFLVVDSGLATEDRAILLERYCFLEFTHFPPADDFVSLMAQIRAEIRGPFWLHLGQGWRFFAPEPLIGRLTGALEAEPDAVQVGVNLGDAKALTGASAAKESVRKAPDGSRYVLTQSPAYGPAMFDTKRLDRTATNPVTATLDEVLCIASP